MTLSDRERARRVGISCCNLVRNVAYYRGGHKLALRHGLLSVTNVNVNLWRTIDGNFMDSAVLDWCKIFADSKGKHSWRKLIPQNDQADFYTGMLGYMRITEAEFILYTHTCRTYRDKFVAHLDEEREMTLPLLKKMVSSSKFLCDNLQARNPEWFGDELPEIMAYYSGCYLEVRRMYNNFI